MDKKISDRLKEARQKKGLKQKDMAEKLGISRAGYSRLENGYVELTTKNLLRIAEILDISMDWLLFGKEVDQTKQGFFSDFGKYAGSVSLLFDAMKEDESTMHCILAAFFEKKGKEIFENKEKEKEHGL
jgi:transcriptional regulator with XRE-family HTH domain